MSPKSPPTHLVHVYESDTALTAAVTAFLSPGIATGGPVFVIATRSHRAAFTAAFAGRGVDADRITWLDAHETLAKVMVDGLPDLERLRSAVGSVFERATGNRLVMVFGEMVDVLWHEGNRAGALRLEELWDELLVGQPVSLLCAYGAGAGPDAVGGGPGTSAPRAHAGSRAAALMTEIERRRDVERELKDFLENAPIAIHSVDADGTIAWANAAELHTLGYTAAEYIGHHHSEFTVDPMESADLLAAVKRGETVRDREIRLRAKDGSVKHLLVSSTGYMNDGKLAYTRSFMRDVTAAKRAEEEERQLVAELERTVRLNEMLAGVMAHDLRNPLSAMMTGAALLLRRSGDEATCRNARRIHASGERMTQMIDQLLDMTRARMSGGILLARQQTSLRALVAEAIEEIEVGGAAPHIALEATGDLEGSWDPARLSQVLSNLVGNAVQHATGGQVSVALDGSSPECVRIEVHNRGVIPPELLPMLFDPFRISKHRSRGARGLGLGLFITHEIVRAHGGQVSATSSEVDGTRLMVELPRLAGDAAALASTGWRTTRDIIEDARQAQAEAESAKNRALLMVANIRDYAVFMLDPTGHVLSWNKGAEIIKGYRPDEIIGRHFSVFYLTEEISAGKCERELELAAAEGRWEDEGWRLRKDGSRFWANIVVTALRDPGGKLVGFAKVARDLSERRRTEERLRQSEERVRRLVDAVHDYAIFMLDPTGTIATWNPGAERITGYCAAEIVGRHFSVLRPDGDGGDAEAELATALAHGRFEQESWRLKKDGSRFWANVVVTPIRDEQGRLMGFTKITRDLTERKQLEEERLRLAQAQEAIRLRDEFLSLASHELKTPVTALQLQLDSLRDRMAALEKIDTKVARKIDQAAQSGERLADLIEDLLDVSRIATGRMPLRPEPLNLADTAHGVVERMRDAAVDAGCELSVKIERSILGSWDRLRLEQLLTHLISNSLKYAPGAPVEVRVGQEHQAAVLQICDRGPGLGEGDVSRIFDRFGRNATCRESGLGLGLYVARQIAEAHGGTLTAGNAHGGGACFTVRLPFPVYDGALSIPN